MDPPDAVITLRQNVERSILGTYGMLPALVNAGAAGTALRESWRASVALGAVPVAEMVQGQLREALGEPALTLDMRRARSADVATLVRAVSSLVAAGLKPEDAREVVGL